MVNRFSLLSLLTVFVLAMMIGPACATPQFSTLYSFNATQTTDPYVNSTGHFPRCTLVRDSSGNFYGTNEYGGAYNYGTIFKITPSGVETTLASFQGTSSSGAYPLAGLTLGNDGNFYGTTNGGGAGGTGTIFKVTPSGSLTTLYSFTAPDGNGLNTDGRGPWAGLTLGSDGNFYGTSNFGGTNGSGTIFKITPAGVFTVLFEFNGTNGAESVQALTLGTDGNFYGVTNSGGANGHGTIYRVTPTGILTTLYNFSASSNGINTDGYYPWGSLVQGSDGNFYGTASHGGAAGEGTVYKITPGGTFTTLASFNGTSGDDPYSTLIIGPDGDFYGTTRYGGANGVGAIFKISATSALTKVTDFNINNGDNPQTGLALGSDGNFYGVTPGGALVNTGSVFRVTSSGTLTTLFAFVDTGVSPFGSLVNGSDGNFYGTTQGGGQGSGVVYKVSPGGVAASIHNFSPVSAQYPFTNTDGAFSDAPLLLDTDGNFYGTAQGGGAHGTGTIFKITPAGAFTTLHSFSISVNGINGDGADPQGALVRYSDGSLYGTTFGGGATGNGTVFKITTAGVLTSLVSFTGANGVLPFDAVVLASDGNFYGTTYLGGAYGRGTVFQMTPAGNLVTIHSFGGADGEFPYAGLILGQDGALYGSTTAGGMTNEGTVFKVTTAGAFTTLASFDGSNGNFPETTLVLGNDGNFYGTTLNGGANGTGNVFLMTPAGTLTDLYDFTSVSPSAPYANPDGDHPVASLLESPSGTFYGTALSGGTGGNGTIYKLAAFSPPTWNCKDTAAVPDGTARMLWDRSDGAAGIWALNAANTQTAVGTVYGPYADSAGTWSAKAISAASDGTTKMLWTKSDGTASVWTLNAAGTQTLAGPSYGPYADSHGTWSAADIAAGPSGASRILWVKSDGTASVWTMNASDAQATTGPSYGPYSGWTAKAVGAASDGTGHILWTNVNRTAGLWTLNASDVETSTGTVYGPYSDSGGFGRGG